MRNTFHTLKRVALALLLASSVSGLALAGAGTSVSHAATLVTTTLNQSPSISASTNYVGEINVTGGNVTPGGSVLLRYYAYNGGVLIDQVTVTATSTTTCNYVTGLCYFPGRINVSRYENTCGQNIWVIAYDYGKGEYSNWSEGYIWCAI